MDVTVDGVSVLKTRVGGNALGITSQRDYQAFTVSLPAQTLPKQLRIYFLNDYYVPPADRNLRVDKVVFDGLPVETEQVATRWRLNSDGSSTQIGGGTEWLYMKGYFEFKQ